MKPANKLKKALAVFLVTQLALTPLSLLSFAADSIDLSNATYFTFSDTNNALTIKSSGTYVVSGTCANGTIVVKKNVTGVTLVLNGLTLTASATAPITVGKGSGVTIYAAPGTTNNLSDDKYNNDDVYTDETLYPDIENAVIKCKDGSNVTLGGTGTVNVAAYGKNGVKGGADLFEEDADGNATDTLLSTASLTIEDVTLNVTIKHSYKDPEDASSYDGDAIKAEKELNILSGTVTVSANDDGTWRRLIVIPFNAKITGSADITNFADYLYGEAGPAIMKWI
ncbi:MAG: carbohydrate-binding domain-containing protein, partial [Clostridia bacterium]|nr:carbohydrate-binding domain-containing protein [Clostridia bacterium]